MLRLTHFGAGALQGIDLTVQAGEIVCLTGPSGSGKTRLLRAIADLDPHDGNAVLNDTAQFDVSGADWRRQVMMVPAESQWWDETVAPHFPADANRDWIDLGFPENPLSWRIDRLSTGEKQRLALWRALAWKPSALLLDEPTANLDEHSRRLTEDWLVTHIRHQAWPVIWVAHDEAQIERVGDRHIALCGEQLKEGSCPSSI